MTATDFAALVRTCRYAEGYSRDRVKVIGFDEETQVNGTVAEELEARVFAQLCVVAARVWLVGALACGCV